MNRADVMMLLRRLHTAYALQRPADSDQIDEWQRQLVKYDPIDAFNALDRIVHTEPKAPSCARVIAEINAHVGRKEPPKPLADPDCPVCDGTGWMYVSDGGTTAAAPCDRCRPDHPWHKNRDRSSRELTHFGIMDGADERINAYRTGGEQALADVLRRQFGPRQWHRPGGVA